MRVLVPVLAACLGLMAAAPIALAAPIAPPLATAQTADEVGAAVKDLYVRYFAATMATRDKPDSEMPAEFDWEKIADGYFAPELATRFKKALSGPEPVIDWDFFIDGQDFDALKVVDAKATQTGDTAMVAMTTSNSGRESKTNVQLAKTAEGWRITDFEFWPGTPDTTTLTAILKDAGF